MAQIHKPKPLKGNVKHVNSGTEKRSDRKDNCRMAKYAFACYESTMYIVTIFTDLDDRPDYNSTLG